MVSKSQMCVREAELTPVYAYIHQIQLSIDHALAISYRRSMHGTRATFVAHISLVKGVPFYGFHTGFDFFLKIYMLNPLNMTRLADLLRQGAIMKYPMQPYEGHMQFISQWMCDYNLYGCSYIDCLRVGFRSSAVDREDCRTSEDEMQSTSKLPSKILDQDEFPKQSHCSIEVDIRVEDIANRANVKQRSLHHDFIELCHPIPDDEKLVQSMAGLWRDETKRRQKRIGITDPSSSPFPPDVLMSVSAEPRNNQVGGWIHEDEYRERIHDIVNSEKEKGDSTKITFGDFLEKIPFEDQIQTSFESVEDLYEENIVRASQDRRHLQRLRQQNRHEVLETPQVDESRLYSLLDEEYPVSDEGERATTPDNPMSDHLNASEDVHRLSLDQNRVQHNQNHQQIEDQDLRKVTPSKIPTKPALKVIKPSMLTRLPTAGVHRLDPSLVSRDAFELTEEFIGDIDADLQALANDPSVHERKKRKLSHPHHKDTDASRFSSRVKDQVVSSLRPDVDTHVEREPSDISAKKLSNDVLDDQRLSDNTRKPSAGPTSARISEQTALVDGQLLIHMVDGAQAAVVNEGNDARPETTPTSDLSGGKASTLSVFTSGERDQRVHHTVPGTSGMYQRPTPHLVRCAEQVPQVFDHLGPNAVKLFATSPMTLSELQHDFKISSMPTILHQDPYYSIEDDVPERPREYAGKESRIGSKTLTFLPNFNASGLSSATAGGCTAIVRDKQMEDLSFSRRRHACDLRVWEFKECPPSVAEVRKYIFQNRENYINKKALNGTTASDTKQDISQIDYATQKDKHGFKYSQKRKSTSVQHETQYMSIMSVEIHVNTRGSLLPNPEHDEVLSIFWSVKGDKDDGDSDNNLEIPRTGVILLCEDDEVSQQLTKQTNVDVEFESSELDTITRLVDIVRQEDPDIITGYEVHGSSWGYLIERARCKYDYDLCDEFSRVASDSHGRFGKEADRWGFNHTSTIRVTGRHMINIWRAMRGELNLLQYTMEHVVFQLCHRRIPHYSFPDLTNWYQSGKPRDIAKVLIYYITRVRLDLEILEQNELVPRTSEQARLLGVDFFSVFSRGSQFKVESLMFRIAKPENLLLPSPSRKQVGQQNALECLPLVMEPQSAFFTSPVLVLDFQSLYPSVMIAYNYCYSTCIGRVVNWRGQNKMGFTDYHRRPRLLELLADHINVAPNGVLYAGPKMRKSLLAKMLSEILETRVMVKSGMKADKEDKTLQRLLNNRQLALKLIANVTYGYTSASFSGRMPCSEIADSIVQTGREILEKTIALIHSVKKWGAEVVYGDTDSLFVHLKGRSKAEAFDIGRDIADTVTKVNPRPIKLKFEKVYLPCVLLAKKRYVGFKYESKDQKEGDFDAKGIETIRRDGTPAEQKIEEKALKILFRTADLSEVKRYFQAQCEKIMRGKISVQDFCFAKEVKLGTYSDKGPPPPGALISTKKMLLDPRAEPQYGERVPYVVIAGGPGARLIDRCVTPETVLRDVNLELDAEYYIGKNLVPPLERIFNLVGANVRQWYDEMPKFQRIRRVDVASNTGIDYQGILKKTLESYMKSSLCLVCRRRLEEESGVCERCAANTDVSLLITQARLRKDEQHLAGLASVCRSCAGIPWGEEVLCDSRDCPVFYTRTRQTSRLKNTSTIASSVQQNITMRTIAQREW